MQTRNKSMQHNTGYQNSQYSIKEQNMQQQKLQQNDDDHDEVTSLTNSVSKQMGYMRGMSSTLNEPPKRTHRESLSLRQRNQFENIPDIEIFFF